MTNTSVNYISTYQSAAANHDLASPWLIFTGLNGLLTDSFAYSAKPALKTLEKLKTNNIPVIFNSNKTFSELVEIRKLIGNDHPFIIENGSAICVPEGYFKFNEAVDKINGYAMYFLGDHYSMVIQKLHRIRKDENLNFAGFYDWDKTEIAKKAGINQHLALLNQQRLCSEPILWHDTAAKFELFKAELEKCQLTITPANNFFLIAGKTNKASAMELLKEKYQEEYKNKIRLFALSNSVDDQNMLKQADFSSAISIEQSTSILRHSKDTFFSKKAGGEGWAESIEYFLKNRFYGSD